MFLVLKRTKNRNGLNFDDFIHLKKSQSYELTTFHEELYLIIQQSSLKLRQRPSNEQ